MPLCVPCQSRGSKVAAHRIVSGVPKCDACWRSNAEPLKPIGRDHPEAHKPAVLTNEAIGARLAGVEKPKASPELLKAFDSLLGFKQVELPKTFEQFDAMYARTHQGKFNVAEFSKAAFDTAQASTARRVADMAWHRGLGSFAREIEKEFGL